MARNNFDYMPSENVPDAFDDRRGLPYGPPYDSANPDDGIERGLLGLFIGVSIKDQFEFLMSDWANKGSLAPGLHNTRDPIIGNNGHNGNGEHGSHRVASDAAFLIPAEGQKRPVELTGLSRFVTCRGAAYCFLPSATAIRYISALPDIASFEHGEHGIIHSE